MILFSQLFTMFSAVSPKCTQSDSFLGFVSWFHYLPRTSDHCDIKNFNVFPVAADPGHGVLAQKSDIPLVGFAVADDLLRLAGIVAIGFVMVGAVQYITSQGNPEETGKAQSTIINAIIGLTFSIVAATIVSFLGNKLGG